MGDEIERKFLVNGTAWKSLAEGVVFRQGYLNSDKERTVRVRTMGDKAKLTIKGPTRGIERKEFEYDIPLREAIYMLDELCEKPLIEKVRREIKHKDGMIWEVDEFEGENKGLVVAEIELKYKEQPFDKPDWVGEDVSEKSKYFNVSLIKNPYSCWNKKE